jgi:hypothetical protein
VIDEAVLLLVGAVVLLIDDDQSEVVEGQVEGRAAPDDDAAAAGGDRVPEPAAALRADAGVPLRRQGAEAASKRASTAWVRAISGSSTSTWAVGSRARTAATASR